MSILVYHEDGRDVYKKEMYNMKKYQQVGGYTVGITGEAKQT